MSNLNEALAASALITAGTRIKTGQKSVEFLKAKACKDCVKGKMCAACTSKMSAGGPGSGRKPNFGTGDKENNKGMNNIHNMLTKDGYNYERSSANKTTQRTYHRYKDSQGNKATITEAPNHHTWSTEVNAGGPGSGRKETTGRLSSLDRRVLLALAEKHANSYTLDTGPKSRQRSNGPALTKNEVGLVSDHIKSGAAHYDYEEGAIRLGPHPTNQDAKVQIGDLMDDAEEARTRG